MHVLTDTIKRLFASPQSCSIVSNQQSQVHNFPANDWVDT